jgi:hypothetical protein
MLTLAAKKKVGGVADIFCLTANASQRPGHLDQQLRASEIFLTH